MDDDIPFQVRIYDDQTLPLILRVRFWNDRIDPDRMDQVYIVNKRQVFR